jgi:hypothetical protein
MWEYESHSLDDINYHNDPRVRARESRWWDVLNEDKMLALVKEADADGNAHWVRFRYDVCPTCNGKGTHVNPSIDCHGITSDEFADDPGFLEDYMRGVFNVTCFGCQGNRVFPVQVGDQPVAVVTLTDGTY